MHNHVSLADSDDSPQQKAQMETSRDILHRRSQNKQ